MNHVLERAVLSLTTANAASLLQVTYNEDAIANVLEDDVEELVEEGEEDTG